jgi:hypothetical protein
MPTTIKLKNSVTTTNAPSTLEQGEVAINVTDSKVWVGNAATTPVQLLGDGSTGSFTSLSVSGVATFSAGTASDPAITTTGDTNTGIFFPAADTIAFAEGGTEVARFNADAQFVAAAGTALLPVITTTGDVNTGIFFSAADTIDFAEGGVATGQFDSSGNFKFNSGFGSVATAYGCRAWVNFNGTGTPAIRASGNVSSITDNGTGDYTVNFTTAMPDANYSTTGTVDRAGVAVSGYFFNVDENSVLAGSVDVVVRTRADTRSDAANLSVAIFR